MLRAPQTVLPREIITGPKVCAAFETHAAKGRLAVNVSSATGSLEYKPVLQGFDPAANEWFDLWTAASWESVSGDFVFYDMFMLFPPSNFVKMYLQRRHRVRFTTQGSGTLTLAAFWSDIISTRQTA